jgi:ubiquinone/menaquinone biosynthesis C-methylase UbiE
VFVKFEQQHYPNNEHTSWNKINECSKVYSSNAAQQLFVQLVSNPKNYNYTLYDEDYGYDEQTLREMMSDYLRLGEIDECRYEDGGCPQK